MNKKLALFGLLFPLVSFAHGVNYDCQGVCTYGDASGEKQILLKSEGEYLEPAYGDLKADCDQLGGVLTPDTQPSTETSPDPQEYCRVVVH